MSIFIYALVCPSTKAIRYIGKTKNLKSRLSAHIAKAEGFHTNNHCANWIRSILDVGLNPEMLVICGVPDDGDWQQVESRVIAQYRSMGHDLTNLTSGGDGFHDMPSEIVAKRVVSRRKTLSDPVRRAAFVKATSASRNNPEVRKKQSDARKARWADPIKRSAMIDEMNTPQAIARRSMASIQTHANPEYAAKHAAKSKEIWNRPERKAEAKARSLKAWANPEITERRIASIKATYATDVMRERMSRINTEIGSRPEVKALRSAKSKAYAADPIRFAARLATMSSSETRAKMSASAKARFSKPGAKAYLSTPEHRKKISDAAIRRSTPEYLANAAAKMKAIWAKRKAK